MNNMYKVKLKTTTPLIYPVSMAGQYSFQPHGTLAEGEIVEAESFKKCETEQCLNNPCQKKLIVVKGKAYCFEHFEPKGFLTPGVKWVEVTLPLPKDTLKEVVVAEGYMQALDFSQESGSYTKVQLKMITPGKITMPNGKLTKCRIIFYEGEEDIGVATEAKKAEDLKKAEEDKPYFHYDHHIPQLGKKKEKKHPEQFRMIRLGCSV